MVEYEIVEPVPGVTCFKMMVSPEAKDLYAKWKVAGKPLPRWESFKAVTGTIEYTDDAVFRDALFAKLLRSPYAHAKIKSIDTSAAEALPGVKAVVTYKDVEEMRIHQTPPDYHLFERLFYVGDIVAAVAAEDEGIAAQALDLIQVEYEPLPFVLRGEDAAKPDAPVLHPELRPNNLTRLLERAWGDVEQGFAQADVTVEAEYKKPNIKHMFTECYAAVAWWKGDELHCRATTQSGAASAASSLAGVLGMPRNKIHFRQCRTGGGFGGKTGSGPVRLAVIAAMLSKKAGGRPVKLRTNIIEQFLTGHTLDPALPTYTYKLGAKNDGTLTALQATIISGQGRNTGNMGLTYVADQAVNNFVVPNKALKFYGYNSNLPDSGALRAFGSQAGVQPIAGIVSELGEKLGMNPIDFMAKNVIRDGDTYTHYMFWDYKLSGGDMAELVQKVAEVWGWSEKWKGWGQPTAVNGSKRRGVGVAVATHAAWGCGASKGMARQFGAEIVKVNPGDGTVELVPGLEEMGSGLETGAIQLAAEVLGTEFNNVRRVPSYSQGQPEGFMTACSWALTSIVWAAWTGAEDVKQTMLQAASKVLNVTPEELELDLPGRKIYVKADPTKSVSLARLAAITPVSSRNLMGIGTPPPFLEGPEVEYDPVTGLPLGMRGIFVSFAEVEVDTETGLVEIVNLVVAPQGGMVLNPAIVYGQTIGGAVHGWSQQIGEGIIYDETTGTPLNPTLTYYQFMTSADVSEDQLLSIAMVHPDHARLAPFKGKGLAEGIYAACYGSIAEAIYNAIGVRVREWPFSPWKILKALGKTSFPEIKGVA